MVLVLILDGIAYLVAVNTISATHHPELVSMLADIFTAVALLTISVGLTLPGMITYSATEVSRAAKRLTSGTCGSSWKPWPRSAAAIWRPRTPRSTSCR